MKLFAARHGETTWNAEKRLMGQLPGELSEKGFRQAQELAGAMAMLGLDAAYASDLNRVVQMVHVARSRLPDLRVTFTPQLRERGFGDYEGRLQSEVDMTVFSTLAFDESKFGIESNRAFTERIAAFCIRLHDMEPGERIGVFCHTGVINRFCFLADPDDFEYKDYEHGAIVEFDLAVLYPTALTFAATGAPTTK